MAIQRVTIGGLEDVLQYDDTEHEFAIETTEVISVGGMTSGPYPTALPVDADLLVFRDISNNNELTTCTFAQLKTYLGL